MKLKQLLITVVLSFCCKLNCSHMNKQVAKSEKQEFAIQNELESASFMPSAPGGPQSQNVQPIAMPLGLWKAIKNADLPAMKADLNAHPNNIQSRVMPYNAVGGGDTVLHVAIANLYNSPSLIPVIEYLLNKEGVEVDAQRGLQQTPLNAPMIQKSDGTLTRPTTDSTLTYFAQTAPKAGSCLVISNNPFIPRQTKVAQRILNQAQFATEGAGPAFKEDIDIVMVMDEFARRIYEECKT